MTETPFVFTAYVTLVTLLVYFAVLYAVGRARVKYEVPVPRMDGPDAFVRILRVQVNTTEQIVLFLPSLWVTALLAGDGVAAALGMLWPLARAWYAIAYYRDKAARMPGFLVGIAVVALLLGISAAQLVRALF